MTANETEPMRFPHAFLYRSLEKNQNAQRFLRRGGKELTELACATGDSRQCVIWFGEYHSENRICALLEKISDAALQLQSTTSTTSASAKLQVVLEHFSHDMQGPVVDAYFRDGKFTDFADFKAAYKEIGTEGHDLDPYEKLFESWRRNADRVKIVGGFIPRPLAAAFCPLEAAADRKAHVQELCDKGYLPPWESLLEVEKYLGPPDEDFRAFLPPTESAADGESLLEKTGFPFSSVGYFRLFESLMSGRDVYSAESRHEPGELFSMCNPALLRMFGAQCLKDWSMAWRVFQQTKDNGKTTEQAPDTDSSITTTLVVAGKAHLHHYLGVPHCHRLLERANAQKATEQDDQQHLLEERSSQELLILSQMTYECDLDEPEDKASYAVTKAKILETCRDCMLLETDEAANNEKRFFPFKSPYADVLYVYDEDDESNIQINEEQEDETVVPEKEETRTAYERVGATAHHEGNLLRAQKWLTALGYTLEEQEAIGKQNLYNFQGVGNPFLGAKICAGEKVLELGCGLGVDAFLAASKTGEDGTVLAVDFSRKELDHAKQRAEREGRGNIGFVCADIERLPFVEEANNKPENGMAESAFDVCISNGAFCLIPNKVRAFSQVYRALKKGGRMAICTTTMREALPGTSSAANQAKERCPVSGAGAPAENDSKVEGSPVEFPICMRMFARLPELEPMLRKIGFSNIVINEVEIFGEEGLDALTDDTLTPDQAARFKIHGGAVRPEYQHLENMDVDEMCASVLIYAEKT
ncbi:unnamed protein product [Amoebophrya sp. A120]|nr:unnamed protein product [Amoebophrya sp. A120]|eukprot:GSA120T00001548001.1